MTTPFAIAVVALAFGLSAPSFAEENHHPSGSPAQAAQATQTPAPATRPMQPGMGPGGMGMMGQGGMGSGGMMGQGPMMGGPMMGMMAGSERIEGRLAFLKTELKITDAQEKIWSDFADAVRQAAAKVQQTHMGMMRSMSGAAGGMTLPQLLDQHEASLAARLEATRAVKAAFGPLYAALDEQQKQTLMQIHPMLHGTM